MSEIFTQQRPWGWRGSAASAFSAVNYPAVARPTLRPSAHRLAASRLDLMQEVWGYSSAVVSRTVDTHIAELRRKLENEPSAPTHILTVRKHGYRLDGRV